jgi:Lrp/AsnC family transcriptional regulator, leucine-responsive regulatory protein
MRIQHELLEIREVALTDATSATKPQAVVAAGRKSAKKQKRSSGRGLKHLRAGLDDADRAILDLLQEDASRNNVKLSKAVKARGFELGPGACGQRRDRLRLLGYIEACIAIVNAAKLGAPQICFLVVRMQDKTEAAIDKFLEAATAEPSVIEIYEMQGLCDFLIKVRGPDAGHATTISKRLRMGIAHIDSFAVGNIPKFIRATRCALAIEARQGGDAS